MMSIEEPAEPFLLRLSHFDTPSPTDPTVADEFYRQLGILMVAWGRLEAHFVVCLLMLAAIDPDLGPGLPMQWRERKSLWLKAFAKLSWLNHWREGATIFASQMEELSLERNIVAHAVWENFDAESPHAMNALTIKAKNKTKDGLEVKRGKVTAATLMEASRTANRLNRALLNISAVINAHRNATGARPDSFRVI
ncbi:hypothetical protein [Bradyrhizobium sp. USDA 4471]